MSWDLFKSSFDTISAPFSSRNRKQYSIGFAWNSKPRSVKLVAAVEGMLQVASDGILLMLADISLKGVESMDIGVSLFNSKRKGCC